MAPEQPSITVHSSNQAPLLEPRDEAIRWVYEGRAPTLADTSPVYRTNSLELSFVNADVRTVVTTIISEAMGQPVAIADGVNGTLTLTSPGRVETEEALSILRQALAASNLTLSQTSSGFVLRRVGVATPEEAPEATDVLPVRNTTPNALLALVSNLKPNEVEARPDDQQRVIILSGPTTDVADFKRTLGAFDLPQLSDRVFGLVPVAYAEPETLADELAPLLQEALGNAYSVVTVIPLPRLGQLFVAASTTQQFDQVQAWVQRVDRQTLSDERQLYYYVAQNAPASTLAEQVRAVLAGGGGAVFDAEQNDATGSLANAQQAGSDISVVADDLNNALIIRATPKGYDNLIKLVERMDILPQQVLIEATIAEVTLNDTLRYGVRWFFNSGNFSSFFPVAINADAGNPVASFPPISPSLSASYVDGVDAGAAINLLSTVTDISVISTPSILVQNNQTASLQVGDEVPIVTQQTQSVVAGDSPLVATVQYRDTGVILQVKPRITAAGTIVLEIDQEVSDAVQTTTDGIESPTIRQRQFSSTVSVEDRGTVVLGGLIRETRTDTDSGIPGLRRLPVVGSVFRNGVDGTEKTELVVFLKPTVSE